MWFLPLFAVFFMLLGTNYWFTSKSSFASKKGILGGPEAFLDLLSSQSRTALLEGNAPTNVIGSGYTLLPYDPNNFITLHNSAFANTGGIFGGILRQRGGFFVYKVQRGDTLTSLAKTFGISTSTIVWANAYVHKGRKLVPNQELTILPISGVLYQVALGDTVESLASLYHVNPQEIQKFNRLMVSSGDLLQGQKIVIPDAKPQKDLAMLIKSFEDSLPNLRGYFIFPTEKSSWNWGILHPNNAIDISNVCGTPIYASAQGIVTDIGKPEDWNNGYGGFVKMEHSNGTETLYAHTEENIVVAGAIVTQGQIIAKIGKSGNVHGPTGCHLHFEVNGAKNPFVK